MPGRAVDNTHTHTRARCEEIEREKLRAARGGGGSSLGLGAPRGSAPPFSSCSYLSPCFPLAGERASPFFSRASSWPIAAPIALMRQRARGRARRGRYRVLDGDGDGNGGRVYS